MAQCRVDWQRRRRRWTSGKRRLPRAELPAFASARAHFNDRPLEDCLIIRAARCGAYPWAGFSNACNLSAAIERRRGEYGLPHSFEWRLARASSNNPSPARSNFEASEWPTLDSEVAGGATCNAGGASPQTNAQENETDFFLPSCFHLACICAAGRGHTSGARGV